jgi:hypothetical protein
VRRDELRTIRADLMADFPDGVPSWMILLPADEVRRLMRLRDEGFRLCGLEPGDDADEIFARGEE